MATVVIEDGVVARLLGREDVLSKIPALKTTRSIKVKAGCWTCRQPAQRKFDYMGAKRIIAGLSDTQLKFLKQVLNAERIKVVYRTGGDQKIEVTR